MVCLNFGGLAKDMYSGTKIQLGGGVGGDKAEKQAPEVGASMTSMGPRNVNFCLRFGEEGG